MMYGSSATKSRFKNLQGEELVHPEFEGTTHGHKSWSPLVRVLQSATNTMNKNQASIHMHVIYDFDNRVLTS